MQRSVYECCWQKWGIHCVCCKNGGSKRTFSFLEFYLGALTTKYDKILTSAQNYTNSGADEAREFQEPRTSILSRVSLLMASSKTSVQRKYNNLIVKTRGFWLKNETVISPLNWNTNGIIWTGGKQQLKAGRSNSAWVWIAGRHF